MLDLFKLASTRGMRKPRISGSAGCCRHGASWTIRNTPTIITATALWQAPIWPWN